MNPIFGELKLNDTTNIEVINEVKTTPEQVEILNKISTIAPAETERGRGDKLNKQFESDIFISPCQMNQIL